MDKNFTSTYVQKINGNDLSKEAINEMVPFWIHTGSKALDNGQYKYYKNDIFFLVRESSSDKLVAMGRLRSTKVKFMEQTYNILGIADIKSIKEQHGYGKTLIQSMIIYCKSNRTTAIGFCNKKNTGFYRKCGLNVIENGVERFISNIADNTRKDEDDSDVIYIQFEDHLLDKFIKNNKENIVFDVIRW